MRHRDPEANRAYLKAWRANNTARIAAYADAHREQRNRNGRLTAQRRRDHRAEVKAAWHTRNKERVNAKKKAWRDSHPGWNRSSDAKRRARVKQATTESVNYHAVLERADGLCGICREPLGDGPVHFDHIVPIARGGAHVDANLQAAHADCNRRKGAKIAA